MAKNDNCTQVQECLEKLLNDGGGGFVPANTVGAGLIAVLSVMSGGSLTPALLGVGGGFVADIVASSSGGESFSFDALKQANLNDIYGNIIGEQELRGQIERDSFGQNPLIANDAVRLVIEGLQNNPDSIDRFYAEILGTSSVTNANVLQNVLQFAQNEPVNEQEEQIISIIDDYNLSAEQSRAIWFASALKSGRVQEFLEDEFLAKIVTEEFSNFIFQDVEGRQLLIDSALSKHAQSPDEFSEIGNLLGPEELSNYLLALQNPAFLPQYSDPAQSAILSEVMNIEDIDQRRDLIRLYAEGGWAIEATLGDDEARTFEADNEAALHQAFIDNPELIRTPVLAELFAEGEVRDSFVNMLLSVNEEEGSVLLGDRVDGLLSEAVDHAVTARLEQYGIVLPEIQEDTYGSTDLIQAQYPYFYGDQHIGYERDEWGNLIFSSNRIDPNRPLEQDHYRTTLDNLPLIGPRGYESAYALSLFSYIPQDTGRDPGFWNTPSNNPGEASAHWNQQVAAAAAQYQLPPDFDPSQYIKRSDVDAMIASAVQSAIGDIDSKITNAVDKKECKCDCNCSDKDISNDDWEDSPEAMAGESQRTREI